MWEWSHSVEAYENARANLERRSLSSLQVMAAEWRAAELRDNGCGYEFNNDRYKVELKRIRAECKAQRLHKDTLAAEVWQRTEAYRTCDNGGHMAHCCPFGCHKVSFSTPQELMAEGKQRARDKARLKKLLAPDPMRHPYYS